MTFVKVQYKSCILNSGEGLIRLEEEGVLCECPEMEAENSENRHEGAGLPEVCHDGGDWKWNDCSNSCKILGS